MEYLVDFFAKVMALCHQIVPNYWLDIVLFTLVTKVLQYPVSLWCQSNALKMVALMPKSLRLKIDYYGDADTIGERTAELYKQEHYHPLLSLLPLAIQIVILMAFVKVIYGIAETDKASLIGKVPVQDGGWAWVMPAVAGASAWLLGWCQNRINPLQREQGRAAQRVTNGISIAISLFLGAFVGMGVGLYWACSNLFSILVQLACNWNMKPEKHVDYAALRKVQAELKKFEDDLRAKAAVSPEDRKREKADYKRFFSVANKHLVFYAEGGGYYKYLRPVVEWLLAHSNVTIHYVTNDPRDAIFALAEKERKIRPYYIGPVRIIPLFMKMDADMVVMTTPDLGSYHIKRSYVRKDVEYVYVNHAATSVHMCTRRGAFDNFDTICSNGEYQSLEFRAIEKLHNLKEKKLVETGYPYFDTLFSEYHPGPENAVKRIMIAPSHQKDNIFELCLDELVETLCGDGRLVIIRPHPQFVRRNPAKVAAVKRRFSGRADVVFEDDFSKKSSLYQADILVTDWSGISCEFSFTTGRQCIFIDTPMKVINPEYTKIDLEPSEIFLRNRIGRSFAVDKIGDIPPVVAEMLKNPVGRAAEIRKVLQERYFNPGHAGEVAGRYILESLIKRKKENRK